MFLDCVLHAAIREHLDLVELVDPDDPPGVPAMRPSLTPVTGRPARVAQWAVGQVDDLIGVQPGQGDLAGTHQVQVVGLDPVDLLGMSPEEPGPSHDLGAHHRRRDDGSETLADSLRHGQVVDSELELCPDPGQEIEPRPRHLGAAHDVDRAGVVHPVRDGLRGWSRSAR